MDILQGNKKKITSALSLLVIFVVVCSPNQMEYSTPTLFLEKHVISLSWLPYDGGGVSVAECHAVFAQWHAQEWLHFSDRKDQYIVQTPSVDV